MAWSLLVFAVPPLGRIPTEAGTTNSLPVKLLFFIGRLFFLCENVLALVVVANRKQSLLLKVKVVREVFDG